MTGGMEQAKRPVNAALAGPYGHPWHPILVTVPIGAWVASLVFDVGSYLVDDPGFLAQGSRWLIAIGVLGALAAATVGFLDLFAIPTATPAFRTGLTHMALNLLVTAAYAANFGWRYSHADVVGTGLADQVVPVGVGAGPLALSVASLVALTVSGYLGGKLAYRYGVRVAAESTQAEGYRTTGPTRHNQRSTG